MTSLNVKKSTQNQKCEVIRWGKCSNHGCSVKTSHTRIIDYKSQSTEKATHLSCVSLGENHNAAVLSWQELSEFFYIFRLRRNNVVGRRGLKTTWLRAGRLMYTHQTYAISES